MNSIVHSRRSRLAAILRVGPSRTHSLTVVVRKSFLSRARKQAVKYANFCNMVLVFLLSGLGQVPRQEARAAGGPPVSEYQVKAAFLLNFTRFVDWPDTAFADPNAPVSICIWGDDPFGRVLDQTVEGEMVNSRKVILQRLHRQPSKSCQVLFIGAAEKDVPKVLSDFGPGVLTVGDGDNFLHDGGMISFVIENRRVRFDVSQGTAARAGLRVSSKLLTVARFVEK